MNSGFGAFLDSSIDRISDFFYLFGFWVLCWRLQRMVLATALMFSAFLFTFMISYIKARGESLGVRCDKGLMERGWRTLFLILWALALSIFSAARETLLWWGLAVFCVLTLFTAIQRIVFVRSGFITQKPPT